MRAGNLKDRIAFYQKVITRDVYGASVDTWPNISILTRGEVRYTGGNRNIENEEKTYNKYIELYVRYDAHIEETMRVQINNTTDAYAITYLEIIGKKEGIKLTIEKINEDMATSGIPLEPIIDDLGPYNVTVNTLTPLVGFLKGDGDNVYADNSTYVHSSGIGSIATYDVWVGSAAEYAALTGYSTGTFYYTT